MWSQKPHDLEFHSLPPMPTPTGAHAHSLISQDASEAPGQHSADSDPLHSSLQQVAKYTPLPQQHAPRHGHPEKQTAQQATPQAGPASGHSSCAKQHSQLVKGDLEQWLTGKEGKIHFCPENLAGLVVLTG